MSAEYENSSESQMEAASQEADSKKKVSR